MFLFPSADGQRVDAIAARVDAISSKAAPSVEQAPAAEVKPAEEKKGEGA